MDEICDGLIPWSDVWMYTTVMFNANFGAICRLINGNRKKYLKKPTRFTLKHYIAAYSLKFTVHN